MIRSLKKLSHNGDDILETWDPETASKERLEEIEREYSRLTAAGYWAVDVTDQRNVITKQFDPNADTLLIPKVAGGLD